MVGIQIPFLGSSSYFWDPAVGAKDFDLNGSKGKKFEMDGSAREAAPSDTEKPDDEDEVADAVKDCRTSKLRTLHEPYCARGGKIAGKGGSYKWTCLLCSTDDRPCILSGSSSKVPTHYRTFGPGEVRACNGLVNSDQASLDRLKEAGKGKGRAGGQGYDR